ncbi:MAG: 4-hydroxy-tetrahydrodipicolinate reductase [Myxococcota bacterium]|nr:4-hydroxy-tetrahydrodipicolinate reductase [Myxococcota bacterium]
MIEAIVSGGAGRLGSRIVEALRAEADFAAPILLGRNDAPDTILSSGRILIATAPHHVTVSHCEIAAKNQVPVIVATTGFESSERKRIEQLSVQIPVILAPNLSPGVTVLLDLVEKASRALEKYDLEIFEIHHNKKKDAPSGTALALAEAAARGRDRDAHRDMILARAGDVGERGRNEIGVQTLRGGDVIGEHTLMLIGQTERLELVHRAQSRDVFAAGAVVAARFISTAAPGLYSMRDVLGLSGE